MNRPTTSIAIPTRALNFEALANISASFEFFCLASGMEALGEMIDHDVVEIGAAAIVPIVSMERCMAALHLEESKLIAPDFERLARIPWPVAVLILFSKQEYNSIEGQKMRSGSRL